MMAERNIKSGEKKLVIVIIFYDIYKFVVPEKTKYSTLTNLLPWMLLDIRKSENREKRKRLNSRPMIIDDGFVEDVKRIRGIMRIMQVPYYESLN